MPIPVLSNLDYGLVPLITTTANCENTTAQVNIVSVQIPAGFLDVGDVIVIEANMQRRQNAGGNATLTNRLLIDTTVLNAPAGTTIGNAAATTFMVQRVKMHVTSVNSTTVGLQVFPNTVTTPSQEAIYMALGVTSITFGASTTSVIGNVTTANAAVIHLSAQWSVQNANTWVRVIGAQGHIIKKAT